MILGDRVCKVTDWKGNWIVVKRSDRALTLYRSLDGWKVEDAFLFTKEEYDANIEEIKRNANAD